MSGAIAVQSVFRFSGEKLPCVFCVTGNLHISKKQAQGVDCIVVKSVSSDNVRTIFSI